MFPLASFTPMAINREQESRVPRGFSPKPYSYHQEIEIEIESLTNMGQGVGRDNGWVVMTPFALPGERAQVRIYRNNKSYSEADLVQVLRRSPDRINPVCPVFQKCGGCQYQHLKYESQLEWKTRQVKELLWHMARIESEVLPAIQSPKTYGYRSKLTPHFPKPKPGKPIVIGFLKQGMRSKYIEIEQCPLVSETMNQEMKRLREHTQNLHREKPFKKGATLLLREHLDGISTDPKEIIREQVAGVVFSFPAGEFFQNNPSILEDFTNYVGRKASQGDTRHLIDAYCGSGLFSLNSAHLFESVIGIEVSELSVQYATQNASANGIENASFVLGDAASLFDRIDIAGAHSAVVIDPPRKGASEEFIHQLIAFGPARVVYVSCNPATQMRDLKTLTREDYSIEEIQPFDLFPQTKHLECVITLARN
tara:strand:+ start:2392 stop:3663 length:1272 start_codon:yes stop_codon:yes gene_type:complete